MKKFKNLIFVVGMACAVFALYETPFMKDYIEQKGIANSHENLKKILLNNNPEYKNIQIDKSLGAVFNLCQKSSVYRARFTAELNNQIVSGKICSEPDGLSFTSNKFTPKIIFN